MNMEITFQYGDGQIIKRKVNFNDNMKQILEEHKLNYGGGHELYFLYHGSALGPNLHNETVYEIAGQTERESKAMIIVVNRDYLNTVNSHANIMNNPNPSNLINVTNHQNFNAPYGNNFMNNNQLQNEQNNDNNYMNSNNNAIYSNNNNYMNSNNNVMNGNNNNIMNGNNNNFISPNNVMNGNNNNFINPNNNNFINPNNNNFMNSNNISFMNGNNNYFINPNNNNFMNGNNISFMNQNNISFMNPNNYQNINPKYSVEQNDQISLRENLLDNEQNDIENSGQNEINTNEIINQNNSLEQELAQQNNGEDDPIGFKKSNLILNFLIILTQFIVVASISLLSIFLLINEKFIISINPILIPIILPIIMTILSIISNEFLQNYKQSKGLIIYHIIYTIIMSCLTIFLSFYIEKKYIIIGLGLILVETISFLILTPILKKYEKLYFGIIASIPSIIGLILISIFLIKSLLPIIYISIYGLVVISYYIGWLKIYLSNEFCRTDEYLYSTIIFDYGLFLGIEFLFSKGIKFIWKKFIIRVVVPKAKIFYNYYKDKLNSDDNYYLKLYIMFLAQYVLITIFTWIGFSLKWNIDLKYNLEPWIIITSLIHIIAIITIFCRSDFIEHNTLIAYIIYSIEYIPAMIIYYFLFSLIAGEKYILSIIFILFIDAFTTTFSNYFFKNNKFGKEYIVCFIANLITLTFYYFFWLTDTDKILPVIGINIFIFASFVSFPFIMEKYWGDKKNLPLLIYDNLFFIIVLAIALVCFYIFIYIFCTVLARQNYN